MCCNYIQNYNLVVTVFNYNMNAACSGLPHDDSSPCLVVVSTIVKIM